MASPYDDLDRPPLQAAVLERALVRPRSTWTAVEVLTTTPSTNTVLRDRAADPASTGCVVVAEHQTAGRGRLGRAWVAPPRSAITVSALVRPVDVEVACWPWIPLLTGLALAAALRRTAEVEATLKWPNDVLIGDKKVAGILVERIEAQPLPAAAVIGMGINVSLGESELPVPEATSLLMAGASTTDRTVLLRAVLRALERLLTRWESTGGDVSHGLLDSYVAACSTIGRQVQVQLPDGERLTGEATGIDATGRLLVRTATGQRAISSADLLHVRAADGTIT